MRSYQAGGSVHCESTLLASGVTFESSVMDIISNINSESTATDVTGGITSESTVST